MTLLPTLNRISKLTNFMKSAVEAKTSTPGMVIVDTDDYLLKQNDYLRLESELFPIDWKLRITKARGMGDKVREVWDSVRDHAWVNILNDDHYIVTPEWDLKLIKQLNGKNFITCNDGWNAPARAAGATIFSMPLLECVGWPIFPPQINHLGIDDCWERLGRTTGTWRVDMRVLIGHQHVFKGADNDETHKLTYGEGNWHGSPMQIDVQQRMDAFMQQEFQKAVDKIKAFSGVNNYFIKLNPQGNRDAQMIEFIALVLLWLVIIPILALVTVPMWVVSWTIESFSRTKRTPSNG